MGKVININEAKQSAREMVQNTQEFAEKRNSVFEALMKEIENVNPVLGGFEELAAILSLSDEHFAMVAPIFLNELEKSFGNMNDKLLIAQAMNAAGLSSYEVQQQYKHIAAQLDKDFAGVLPQAKVDFLKKMLAISYNAMAEINGVEKRIIQIPIERCHPDARIPTYANVGDAGLDVYALEDITIHPGETKLIKTGIKVAIPYGYELQVRPKSGRALKTKFRVANTPGTIDSGYRDEIGVIIDNIEPPIADIGYHFEDDGKIVIDSILHGKDFTIGKGEKFAQLVLNEVPKVNFFEVESVANIEGDRGGGFGSSGLK